MKLPLRKTPPSDDDFPKLSNPARRALANAGIRHMKDLTRITEADCARLHGIGPSTVTPLKAAMRARGLTFKKP
jgi:hypothetical protein